jgi:hypothetical protein
MITKKDIPDKLDIELRNEWGEVDNKLHTEVWGKLHTEIWRKLNDELDIELRREINLAIS